jgi:hypothetical protein
MNKEDINNITKLIDDVQDYWMNADYAPSQDYRLGGRDALEELHEQLTKLQ